ncbi:SDR family oxidoreductase [Schumannella soli]|uniref:SDR family NAD(P)-dependent oxidoreductase n=1 Tax=Schumannella soli TaxID=2590779 RepID=A0A506Y6M5_9MICO|nr:SDR family oxidoreductase [Schumannella soli]TPW77170.1 SDR family NAD(P)-dependent oxidoreductase [Schumannella soli]
MKIDGTVALVTGANRGIGRQLAAQLRDRGASVWAAARNPDSIDLDGVRPLRLDITDPGQVAAAAAQAGDVQLLINNAGIATRQDLIAGDLDLVRLEMETHYFGTLSMARAFAPVLAANGGGAIANVLSALSWFSTLGAGAYAPAKAAEWALTAGIRLELAGQGTQVTGIHLGAADTDIMAGYDGPMVSPAEVARVALDGIENGDIEVLVDEWSRHVKGAVTDPVAFYGEQLAQLRGPRD